MQSFVPFYSKIPFLRLLLPLSAGILLQWNYSPDLSMIYYAGGISLLLFIFTQFFFLKIIFKYGWITGIIINSMLVCLGALLSYQKNIHNDQNFFGKFYNSSSTIKVTILEPPIEKEKSFKALAEVDIVIANQKVYSTKGKIILYFKKDSSIHQIHFGSTIIFNKTLQEIKNSVNPGAFDYKRYCLFNGITHQVYLRDKDFVVMADDGQVNWLDKFLFNAREKTISVLRKFISYKKELGLAEALLINYKDDLDKGLIQSYTNTGVVHIIAISGQHLALIYWLLLQMLSPLKRAKRLRWLITFIILFVLWLFSLMTGAQPSIIRAALMCTIMLLAEVFSRRSNTMNSLACSAFILLCFNPFDLWDVGFQLSYTGLLSLVLFTRLIYNLIYAGNKILQHIWQLIAASIAAQILTTPISIYHFHQFPFSFMLTNLLAVPLSSLVLTLELSLFIFSFIAPLAMMVGKLLTVCIWLMNTWVERIEGIHGLLWDGLQISIAQTILLYIAILGFNLWLIEQIKKAVWITIAGIVLFFLFRIVLMI
jgi:competence protein ComEC